MVAASTGADVESLPFDGSEFDHVLSAIGVMFATMKPFAPAPPPPLWGDEQHVGELLGDFAMKREYLVLTARRAA